jgi:hypothetical protein
LFFLGSFRQTRAPQKFFFNRVECGQHGNNFFMVAGNLLLLFEVGAAFFELGLEPVDVGGSIGGGFLRRFVFQPGFGGADQ